MSILSLPGVFFIVSTLKVDKIDSIIKMTIDMVKKEEVRMKFVSVAEAKAKFSEILRESKKEDIIITSRGKPKALIQSLEGEDFEDFLISHSRKIRESIEKAWEECKRGEVIPLEEFMRRAKRK